MKPDLALKLPKSGHYIVAVSGGVDSVTLLHLLATQPDHNLRLRVAHVNHGLRPDAASDERFVRELAAAYGLPFYSTQLELGQASEAAAREARYNYLFDLMKSHGAQGIITAHHGDDQVETSVFNTLRGSGRHGQAASLERQRILRPLLNLKKAELYDYAKARGLAWREDPTNQDTAISRNFIRHELLGQAPAYSERHAQLMAKQQELNRVLDQKLRRSFYDFKTARGLEIPRSWLAAASWHQAAMLFHFALRQLVPAKEFSHVQIEELVRLAKTAPAGSQVSLPGSLKLQVGYDKVGINVDAGQTEPQIMVELQPGTSLTFGPFRLVFGLYRKNSANSINLEAGRYFARTVQPGDRMRTSGGTKKIQDIFVDKKISRDRRQAWPIIINEAETILWLPQLAQDPSLTALTGYQLIAEEV